jgi:2-dehydropantoate 2-reductase
MKVLVLGAGGLGGYFGGRLVQGGADVTFLVRERRQEQLSRDGLRIESPLGDVQEKVRALQRDELEREHDLVLLTCKAYDLDDAMDAVAPALKPDGMVLPLLNGLSHIDTLNSRFGKERVLGGVARIGATLTPDGVIRHLNDWKTIVTGEQDGGASERLEAVSRVFAPAPGMELIVSPRIIQEMWDKLIFLATLAGMTSLMRANIGEIVRTPDGAALLRRFFDAAAETARRKGYPPSEKVIERNHALLSDPQSRNTASMLRDLESGGKVEADHILGWLLARARETGVDDTLLSVAYTHLKAYEQRRAADRA